MSAPLTNRYRGDKAADYDRRRSGSPRYAAEEEAFSEFFESVQPSSVLDCPFGTGRWLPYYERISGPIIGLDSSADMLGMAKEKAGSDLAQRLTLDQADIFQRDLAPYSEHGIDLVVCTRFLNWIPAKKAVHALENLNRVRATHAIIGASVRPADLSWQERFRMRNRLFFKNVKKRLARGAPHFIHDETMLLECFERLNWQIMSQRHIFAQPTRVNFFYLLRDVGN